MKPSQSTKTLKLVVISTLIARKDPEQDRVFLTLVFIKNDKANPYQKKERQSKGVPICPMKYGPFNT